MSAIYLAAAFQRQAEMNRYALVLNALGHRVTSRWLQQEYSMPTVSYAVRASYAKIDREDIHSANVFIGFTETPLVNAIHQYIYIDDDNSLHASLDQLEPMLERYRGGRHVELGIALDACSVIYIVGPREHVFHYDPKVIQMDTWDDLLEEDL